MICPVCNAKTRVTDTREEREGRAIRRKRKCDNKDCARTFTTLERFERALVEKRSGELQPFDREKVVKAIRKAASKRGKVDPEKIADRITAEVLTSGEPTPTRKIGASISDELVEVDSIAYLRWSMVFVGIEDLEGVKALVSTLQTGVRVEKSSGEIERFDRAKLVGSVQRAVKNEQLEQGRRIAEAVADEVERDNSPGGIVSSEQIAEELLPKLKDLDKLAWFRYLTVHEDLAGLAGLLQRLEGEL